MRSTFFVEFVVILLLFERCHAEIIAGYSEWTAVSCPAKSLSGVKNSLVGRKCDKALSCALQLLDDGETANSGILWSLAGEAFTCLSKAKEASFCFQQSQSSLGTFHLNPDWHCLGPFIIGKPELDADPLAGRSNGIFNVSSYRYRKGFSILSELAPDATIQWSKVKQRQEGVVYQPDGVDFNDLVRSLGSLGILEWQGWAVGELVLTTPSTLLTQCLGVVAFYVNAANKFPGDVYFRDSTFHPIRLEAGFHQIYVKLRSAKPQIMFRCTFKLVKDSQDPLFTVHSPKFLPDMVDGYMLSQYIPLGIDNRHPGEWLTIDKIELTIKKSSIEGHFEKSAFIGIAPGQSILLPVKFAFDRRLSDSCRSLPIQITVTTSRGSQTISKELRCRTKSDSFLFTFLDHDGSVQHAAALHPLQMTKGKRSECPTVLSLHGTSISPQNQADSYKQMVKGRYVFGVENAWLLAPTRHGAHNWEGPGALTSMAALQALASFTSADSSLFDCAASSSKVIFAGHSMGGHGAWHLATHYPDQAIGVISLAGWIRKESYGDSNLFFRHDVSYSFVSPALKSILENTIAENDADRHVSNIAHVPILARIGANDRTVHPIFVRQMYRLLHDLNADVSYHELPGKEHWWWDTEKENDGGAVNDAQIRKFMKVVIDKDGQESCSKDGCDQERDVTLTLQNPASQGSLRGVHVLLQKIPFRSTSVHIRHSAKDGFELQTENVQCLRLTQKGTYQIDGHAMGVQDDGKEMCLNDKAEWTLPPTGLTRNMRTLGPARRVFEAPFLLVFDPAWPQSAVQAVYLANLFQSLSDTYAPVVSLTHLQEGADYADYNLVMIGSRQSLSHYKHAFIQHMPFQETPNGLRIGSCSFARDEQALLSLVPLKADRLGLLLIGWTERAIQGLLALADPTIPPMARSPFSNLIPDFIMMDSDQTEAKGPGGFQCAGFWSNHWQWDQMTSSCIC